MELTLQEKRKLINFFEFLLNEEVSKPLGEMNSEAVDNYVKILLHLQDKRVELSPEFIDEQVRKIFHPEETVAPETAKTTNKTNKKQINKNKVWLVAACIAILVALFSIVSVANDWNVFDFLSEKFGSVHSAPIEEELDFNGVSVIMNGETTRYKSIKDAFKNEKVKVLYPKTLPNNIEINKVIFYKKSNLDKLSYSFSDPDLYFTICFDTLITDSAKDDSTETLKVNSIVCYIYEMDDINSAQVRFEYNGDTYMLNYTNKEVLIEIIENLEEINNEN